VQSRLARAAVAIGVLAAAVVLFAVLSSGGDDDDDKSAPTAEQPVRKEPAAGGSRAPRPELKTITVRGGEPVGGVKRLEFEKGERVRFAVRSDVADEVHVHGYDRSKDARPGKTVRFSFPATIEGVFEIELEGRHKQIAELRVSP
jgi:hypothetical protein